MVAKGVLEAHGKNRRRRGEESGERNAPLPSGHTLAEILNGSNSHLFGWLLEKDGRRELAERVAMGRLDVNDIHVLNLYIIRLSEKITQAEKVGNLLTEETIGGIASNHPDFEKMINLVGPAQAVKAIRGQLIEKCVTDENMFSQIAGTIEAYDNYRSGEYKATNDKVEKLCKDIGIAPKEYVDALAIEDPEERRRALKMLAVGKSIRGYLVALAIEDPDKREEALEEFEIGEDTEVSEILRRGINTIRGWRNRRKLENAEASMEASIAELDTYESEIGHVLFQSISIDESMRHALSKALVSDGSPVVAESKNGFGDARKDSTISEERFQGEWTTYRDGAGYYTQDVAGQAKIRDSFIADQKKRQRERNAKGTGIWYSIFANLFEQDINNRGRNLK